MPSRVRARQAVVVEQLLPLADHAEVVVVDDQHLDRQLVHRRGGQLGQGHLEAAVADHGPHRLVRTAQLGADGGREAEAHGAGAARRQPVVVLGREQELRGPHLVLAHVGDDDGVAAAQLVQAIEDVLRPQPALLGVVQGELLAPGARSGRAMRRVSPGSTSGRRSSITRRASPARHTSGCSTLPNSATSMSTWIFTASLQKTESLPVMRSSQREPMDMMRSQSVDRLVGVGGAVHAEHAEVQRVILGHRALAEQGVDHGRAQLLGELQDGLARVGRARRRGRRAEPAAAPWPGRPPVCLSASGSA